MRTDKEALYRDTLRFRLRLSSFVFRAFDLPSLLFWWHIFTYKFRGCTLHKKFVTFITNLSHLPPFCLKTIDIYYRYQAQRYTKLCSFYIILKEKTNCLFFITNCKRNVLFFHRRDLLHKFK